MSEREDVREVLAGHFIMWRSLDGEGPQGEWFCECGEKFGFSDSAIDHQVSAVLDSSWLAAHDEAVRVSERVRLAGEVEALARERDDAQHHLAYHLADFRPGVSAEATGDLAVDMAHFAERMRRERDEARAALVPVPGVRLTEEE